MVSEWAKAVGCSAATADVFAEQEIDGATLVELEEVDLLRVCRPSIFVTVIMLSVELKRLDLWAPPRSFSSSARPRRCSST